MITLKRVERPRELKWFQAGAMLYGDWGTSKAYVLGIAFALAGHASWFFLGLMSLLTALVGICYIVICRIYPDGGGVYSSVKHRSPLLASVGAFLLIADYVITASISAVEAFHYFNLPNPEIWAVGSIVAIGLMNWIGPTKSGSLAVIIGLVASIAAGVLFLSTLPHLPHVDLRWPAGDSWNNWSTFVGIVLALSGVEAVANMTGIMVEPVERTAKKAIWPVLLEVSILTFLLGIAMNAIPGLSGHAEDMLRALGNHYIGTWYGNIISVVFGFLLLSAANTAIGDLVSIQFAMARDRELPTMFSKLNRFGMPYLALIGAVAVPVIVLLLEHDVLHLAALYAIGVVGAIALNIGSCATDFNLPLKKWERYLFYFAGTVLSLIWVTIAVQKHYALLFAAAVVGTGLLLRFVAKSVVHAPLPEEIASVNALTLSEAKEIKSLYTSTSMIALRTLNENLLDEAALRVKARNENAAYVIYVEESPPPEKFITELEPSLDALVLLAKAQKYMETRGVTAVPIWRLGTSPGKLIAEAARELDVTSVLIGTTKRSALINLLRGDVFRTLARNLPSKCHLMISS